MSNCCIFTQAMKGKKLVLGAGGQIGVELIHALRNKHGVEQVLATDLKDSHKLLEESGPYIQLDALDEQGIEKIIDSEGVDEVYLLAALLSATGEKNPELAWEVNMKSLLILLKLAKEKKFKIFWPSSIAVYGGNTPKTNAPQHTIIEPSTIYGITKFAGERLCSWYSENYGIDIRSIRYPGLISYKSAPGGGTTDYAVDIFHKALQEKKYTCFLNEDTALPMMYMPDAIRATIEIMEAPPEDVPLSSGYNISAMSFTPSQLTLAIQKHIPDFTIEYKADYRQEIADGWPKSVDDSEAQKDWGWKAAFDLDKMTADMIHHLSPTYV